ncbi:MAG TPA: hypothetical protein VKT31_06990 [Solirubrobacteraceae bacterium]|nr:hypothetical protein [Solirubrobacteraceae bacterium]
MAVVSRTRALLAAASGVSALALAMVVPAGALAGGAGQSLCIGHHPQPYVWYTHSCTGHDEPEIDPLSNLAGSAQDLTWTVVLPTNGAMPVDSVGPTFWIGGTVHDPNSLDNEAFLELQFYPNSIVTNCSAGGGYKTTYSANTYSACSPVWEVSKTGNSESAAFNGMLLDSRTGGPLLMHAGDTITDHQYTTRAADGMHITVTDLTTGHAGTLVLNSKVDGPLMPQFSVQKLGNALGWGLVNDAPNALVWEIGHTGNYTTPAGQFCLPGETSTSGGGPCYSYNVPSWLQFSPLQIKSVTFANGSRASHFSVVSDYGGPAEDIQDCGSYGGPFCQYPWYAYNGTDNAFTFGGDYAGTTNDFGQAFQYDQTENCASPADGSPQYCSTVIK